MAESNAFTRMLQRSMYKPINTPAKVPNELQYDQAGAYSFVAFKNQGSDSRSDLDIAKMAFETKYKEFLTLYGQYSNEVLKVNNVPLTYPINQQTKVFQAYPYLKPSN